MKRHSFALCWLGLLLTGGLAAQTSAPSTKTVTLAYYENAGLYSNGQGFDKDVAEELARRAGWTLETSVMARARIWQDLENGSLALATSGIQTPARDQFAWFVPYLTTKNLVLLRAELAPRIKSFADFDNQATLQLGVVASYKHEPLLDDLVDQLRKKHRVQESPSVEVLFRKMKDGRVDAVIVQPFIYAFYEKEFGLKDSVAVQDWIPGVRGVFGGMVLSKKYFTAQEFARVKLLMDDMKKDGTMLRLALKYLPEAESRRLLEF